MIQPAPGLAELFRQLSDLADIRGAHGDAADLRRARAAIEALPPRDLAEFVHRARLADLPPLPGVSPTLHWRVHEFAREGAAPQVRAATAGIPTLLHRLLDLGTVGTAEARSLACELGVLTYPDLVAAIEDGRVDRALDPPAADRLRHAVQDLGGEFPLTTLGRALAAIDHAVSAIREACPSIEDIVPSGDARRFSPLVSSLIVVGCADDPDAAMDAISAMDSVDDIPHRGRRRAILAMRRAEIDVRVASPGEFGTVLFLATGAGSHVRAVQRGRFALGPFAREEDLYAHAALPFIPPELRDDAEAVAAAEAGTLPALVSPGDMRGDLHVHTTWSDGRDSSEAMVLAARALGYEYLAITDHSERANASRTLSRDQVARQADELARLREQYRDIAILHGIEVDILPDGALDFPDALLESFDIVLASLHERAGQDGVTLTRRYLAALRHPLVTVITHPANRLPGSYDGYPLDFETLYAAAADTGTVLEIDGGPAHLDLDGERARAAVRAGVMLAIDSDCHRAASLDRQMRMGVGTARRGWVEARHVLNTRPVEAVLEVAAAKRAGHR